MIIPLDVSNDFNNNSDNKDKTKNNDDDEDDKVNSNSLSLCNDLDDWLGKTSLREKRKSKRVAAINADIIFRSNYENFE